MATADEQTQVLIENAEQSGTPPFVNSVISNQAVNTAALNSARKILNQYVAEIKKPGFFDFMDGTDTFAATAIRAWLGFFLQKRLPNTYDGVNDGNAWGYVGPEAALLFLVFIFGAGEKYRRVQKNNRLKNHLTEEFLLAYYVAKNIHAENKAEAVDNELEEVLSEIKKAIDQVLDNEDTDVVSYTSISKRALLQRKFKNIEQVAKNNKDTIIAILAQDQSSVNHPKSDDSSWAPTWDTTWHAVAYFGYIHWILWISATLVFAQTIPGYAPESKGDVPGFFSNEALGIEGIGDFEPVLFLQVMLPVLLTAGMLAYKHYADKQLQLKNTGESDLELAEKKKDLRALWLKNAPEDLNLAKNEVKSSTFDFDQYYWRTKGTLAVCTFWGNFLLANIVAWPLIGAGIAVEEIGPEEYIPIVFTVATLFSGYAAYRAVQQSNKEDHDAGVYDKNGVATTKICGANIEIGFKDACSYWAQKEQRWPLAYIVLGRIVGSGGILMARILFNGGMGNFRVNEDGSPGVEMFDYMDIAKIAACLTVVAITLDVLKHYYQAKWGQARQAVVDQKLLGDTTQKLK